MRNLVKSMICQDVLERGATAIITSHSLRELEDTCDQLALLHQGGIVLESDIQDLKTSLFKVQIAFPCEYDREFFRDIDVVHFSKRGSVANLIVRGDREETAARLQRMQPSVLDILPLTLEEVGKRFNVTRERIRQIETAALRKLRNPSKSKKIRDFLP